MHQRRPQDSGFELSSSRTAPPRCEVHLHKKRGSNHIDLHSAEMMGICVENVAYSPDSVADYTLMLMLMILRNTKMTISRVQAYDYRLIDVPGENSVT